MKYGLALIALISSVLGYDRSQKVCWDVRLQNSSNFCYDNKNNGVVWALSEDVFYSAQTRDNCKKTKNLTTLVAAAKYQNLLTQWANGTALDPSNDCLAIAREVYCSLYFPACQDA